MVIFLRRHWFNLFIQLFPFILLTLLLLVVHFLILFFLGPEWLSATELEIARLAAALFGLFLWAFIFIVFLDYYLDIWIVTDQRIVNI